MGPEFLIIVLCGVLAWLIVKALSKPKAMKVGGFLIKGKDGSLGLKLWPATKKKGRKK